MISRNYAPLSTAVTLPDQQLAHLDEGGEVVHQVLKDGAPENTVAGCGEVNIISLSQS